MKDKISSIIKETQPFSHLFPEHLDAISEIKNSLETELKRIEDDEQLLSIGIIGQVKAGKSSFLNALLFNGDPILPEAATPKTANLTRICYGDQPQLTVHYYDPLEWADLMQKAGTEGDSVQARVARDLKEMAEKHHLDVQAILSLGKETFKANDVNELMVRMNDYVGENGSHTALVQSTEIQLPLDELIGFEIVDTPGMNDPVQSRTQKTRTYMAKCDVVFFLSRCSQFLDQSDMQLLAQQLPAKGVQRMVLVAGQFDGAIADDGFDKKSLADTEQNIRIRQSRRAEKEMEQLAAIRENHGDLAAAKLLRSLKIPVFSSTYAHGYAQRDADGAEEKWGKGMHHMYQQLQEMAATSWNGYQFTKEDWERLANFGTLEAAYGQARQDKQSLMQERLSSLYPRTLRNLEEALANLKAAAEQRLAILKTSDIQAIESSTNACQQRISGISEQLAGVINVVIKQAHATAVDKKEELFRETVAAAEIQTRTGTKKVTDTEEISVSKWYNPFSWGKTETVEYTSYDNYEYIATADAVEKVVNYAKENAFGLAADFNRIINMNALRTDLKLALINELNTSSQEFDPAEFRHTLESTLNTFSLPELTLDITDCELGITEKFSGKIRSEKKMEALRHALKESLDLAHQRLLGGLEEAVKTLCIGLESTRDNLEKKLTFSLLQELEQLKSAFSNKEEEMKKYENLVLICTRELSTTSA